MSTPTYYRSTDASAPTYSGDNAESFLNVLQACLVDGYGIKAGAGWTLAFTAIGKRVFRNNPATGTGCYLRIAQDGANTHQFRVTAYATMSDIDTGTTPTNETGLVTSDSGSSSVLRPWQIIADDRTVYIRAQGHAASSLSSGSAIRGIGLVVAGDYISNYSTSFNYLVAGGDLSDMDDHNCYSCGNFYARSTAGDASAPTPDGLSVTDVNFFMPYAYQASGNSGIGQEPYTIEQGLIKIDPLVGGAIDGARHLGKLRGCYFPAQNLQAEYNLLGTPPNLDPTEVEPNLWWLFTSTSDTTQAQSGATGFLIKTDSWA